jgi:hypothetical protein
MYEHCSVMVLLVDQGVGCDHGKRQHTQECGEPDADRKSLLGDVMVLVLDNGHPCFYDMQTTARGTTKFASHFLSQSLIHVQEVNRWGMQQADKRP